MRAIGTALLACALLVGAPESAAAQKKQRDLILREELLTLEKENLDLFNAIKRLRPHFLEGPRGPRTLGGGIMNPILVVVDASRGDAQLLEQLRALDVMEVRYLDPARSQNEYGIKANGGAIVVKKMKAADKGTLPPKPPGA